MEKVIAEDVAREEISSWADALETQIDETMFSLLLPAVTRGRVTFDEGSESFSVTLRKSVEKEGGESLSSVMIREPNIGEAQKAQKYSDQMAQVSHMISAVSGLPVGLISRIGQKDFITLSGLLGFFG